MNDKSRIYTIWVIGLAFFVYGAFRIGVSSLLILQIQEFLSYPELQAALVEIDNFITLHQTQMIIPVSSFGYLCYLWLMAALLIVGAFGLVARRQFGQTSLYIFLTLYTALFVNFQTINPKVFHLVVCALLVVLYRYCVKKPLVPFFNRESRSNI